MVALNVGVGQNMDYITETLHTAFSRVFAEEEVNGEISNVSRYSACQTRRISKSALGRIEKSLFIGPNIT